MATQPTTRPPAIDNGKFNALLSRALREGMAAGIDVEVTSAETHRVETTFAMRFDCNDGEVTPSIIVALARAAQGGYSVDMQSFGGKGLSRAARDTALAYANDLLVAFTNDKN